MPVLTVDQVLTGTTLGLSSGLDDLLVSEVSGRRVLYALNRAENGLIEVAIAANGDLTYVQSVTLSGTFPAGSDPQMTLSGDASGGVFLALSGLAPTDGQQVSLSGSGALGSQSAIAGIGSLSAPTSFDLAATQVLVSGSVSGGLAYYADAGSGFASSSGLTDNAGRYLADVAASVGFEVSGAQYVATVSAQENGVNVTRVEASGLTQTGALGNAQGLPITLPSDIGVFSRLGETMLIVSSSGTSSLSTLRVVDGAPVLADHILDDANTRFQGASSLAALTNGDFAYVAVGGAEGGVSLLTVLPGGRLIQLASVAEDETAPLYQIAALEAFVIGSTLQIYTGSANEAGLARLAYDLSDQGSVVLAAPDGLGASGTALNDQVIGSVASEALSGGDGADILFDGAGNDVLTGGAGADLFVFDADGVADQIADFERGVDRLDLSAFDFLYDVSQLNVLPTATGATLSFGAETIDVTTSDAAPLTAVDLTNDDILNVDRPPFLLIGREIIGNSADETLNGGAGNDTIAGAGGDDSLTGGYGQDVLLGSIGQDTLNGNAGADTLIGGAGSDLLDGGEGGDLLYGDDWV